MVFEDCENFLIKDKADYKADFDAFVWKFKMWCGQMQFEPDFKEMQMTEEAGEVMVQTSPDHRSIYKDEKEHKVGYFAYYNNGLFDNGPMPLLLGFHGGGDSTMYLTFVSEWYKVAHKYNFLYVAIENHQHVTATEAIEVLEELKKLYDETRDSYLTIRYYDSKDGVCRTAFASVSGQGHECRYHTNENAWKFISQFTR